MISKEVLALHGDLALVVIDEIQRCPELLNEVHLLMEEKPNIQFILTGSSARKLRHAGTNLLGGRAITLRLYPLTHEERGERFDIEEAIHLGTLPKIVLEKSEQGKARLLKSYVETYLKEEIQQEALTRNVPAFAKFLELAAYENGNLLNFKNISREVGVSSKTIKEYFNILEDTLLGFYLYPYAKSHRSKHVSHPKFYFFDCGIISALRGELSKRLVAGTPPYGDAFEHFIMIETRRILDYREREFKVSFFRTTDGAEVDLILELGDELWAIEIKSSDRPRLSDVRGLRSYIKDHKCAKALCVCQTPRSFVSGGIEFIPWRNFLKML